MVAERRAKKAANFPVYRPTACAATSAQWHRGLVHGGAGPGARLFFVVSGAHVIGQPRGGRPLLPFKEKTMPASEIEIHAIVLRLLREGYTALTAAQRRVVDTLMAVC